MTLFPGSDNWRAGMQEVSQAIADTMGESVRVTPTNTPAPNFPAVPQYERAVIAQAVYLAPHKTQVMGRKGDSPRISTRAPRFEFALGALPFALQQKFWITRLCSNETFEITDIRSDAVSMIACDCVQLGRAKPDGVRTVDL
ncbi:hypothetical protein [Bradyrhizobium sp.]|uniref:hypothetical protein n=1 Tax=Bradyrhizobium sp. TaxID=376 RepID=UPI0025BEF0C2|nr:hypothetical protein [Bradyrhizobium sp.]